MNSKLKAPPAFQEISDADNDSSQLQAEAHAVLRRKAEESLKNVFDISPERLKTLSPEDTQHILHELRVHQIELEMQNETLRKTMLDLEDSRERYFDLYDVAPVGYCIILETGLISEINLTAATMLGLTKSQVIKQAFSHFLHRDDQDKYYLQKKNLFAGRDPQTCELRLKTKNSSYFWAQLSGTLSTTPDGKPCCRITLTNIDARKQSEAKRVALFNEVSDSGVDYDVTQQKMGELVYRQTLSALDASAIVVMTDRNGKITVANELFCKISGYSREELIGQNHRFINSGFHDRAFFHEMWSTISSGKVWVGEIRNRRKDGTFYWVHTIINPIKSETGEVESFIGVSFDITEQKEAQYQLALTSKLATIGELSAGLGHEINNPLTILMGNISSVRKEFAHDTFNRLTIDKNLDSASKASERIRDVLISFVTFSTIDSALKEQVSTHQCIDSVIRIVEGIFSNDGVKIFYQPGESDFLVEGSSGSLQQVLMNPFLKCQGRDGKAARCYNQRYENTSGQCRRHRHY